MSSQFLRFLAVLLFSLTGFASVSSQEASREKLSSKDMHGDPLPAGAIARLGTVRFHHPGGISIAAFSSDSKTILAVGHGHKSENVRFWEVPSGTEQRRWDLPSEAKFGYLRQAKFSPDGEQVAFCRERGVELYDRAGKLTRTFGPKGDHPSVISIAFSPDGRHLVLK